MGDSEVKSLLNKIGISTAVIGGLIVVGVVMLAYKNFYELQRTKLEILRLQKELGMPQDNNLVKGYVKKIIPHE